MNALEQLLRGGTPQRPAAYPTTEDENFALMNDAGWFNAPQGPQVTQFDPMATDSRLGNAGTVEKEKNALNALFHGAIFSGDLDKATRLAVTPEQQALLGVAFSDRMDRQAGGRGGAMQDYSRAQETGLARSRMEQDRMMKQAEMQSRIRASDANAMKDIAQARQVGMPKPGGGQMQVTEIVDPADPSKMLRIDARVYRGGSVGSPGVIGASGKEPTSAKREETANSGRDGLAADLQLMRDSYAKLKDAKAIPSTESGASANILARMRASAPGQFAGGAIGLEEQVARDEIQAAKRRLLSSIKNITGASAQEMNSNTELKTWMDSLGDTSKIVEGNLNILDAIENKYIKAKDYKSSAAPVPRETKVRKYNPATGKIE